MKISDLPLLCAPPPIDLISCRLSLLHENFSNFLLCSYELRGTGNKAFVFIDGELFSIISTFSDGVGQAFVVTSSIHSGEHVPHRFYFVCQRHDLFILMSSVNSGCGGVVPVFSLPAASERVPRHRKATSPYFNLVLLFLRQTQTS